MSLLGDLQQEVRKIKAQEDRQSAELEAQHEYYQTHLQPVMVRVYEYFAEIVEHLNIVAPDVKASYPLNPLLEGGITLRQSQYKFRSDTRDHPYQIDILCKCTLEKPHEFYMSTPQSAAAHAALLNSYDFPFHQKNRLDRNHDITGATFILEGPMQAHIRVAASPADRCILVGLRNIEVTPIKRYRFKPEAIDDEFLDRLAKVLIRQVPQLVDMQVEQSFRDRLRQQIEQTRLEVELDLTQAYAEKLADEQAEKEAKLNGRNLLPRIWQALKDFLKR